MPSSSLASSARPVRRQDTYTTVGASPPQTLVAGSLNSFATSIPVQAGDTLGLLIVSGGHNCVIIDTGSPEDRTEREEGALFDIGAVHTYNDPSQPARRINVAATVEADANGDGIGDEPPTTKITKGAPKKTEKNKVKFKFSSDDPGASFQCKLDKKAFKGCKSPKTAEAPRPRETHLRRASGRCGWSPRYQPCEGQVQGRGLT